MGFKIKLFLVFIPILMKFYESNITTTLPSGIVKIRLKMKKHFSISSSFFVFLIHLFL